MKPPFIIADVGSNWRRSDSQEKNKELALLHIDKAAQAGCDAVKFQLFTHKELYGFPGDDTYALPSEWLSDLSNRAKDCGIEFMCTAFSAQGVRQVNPFVNIHKVASAEMKHIGILQAIIETGKPLVLSTGAAIGEDVVWVLNKLADTIPVCVLQCVAAYPANPKEYNLGFLAILKEQDICVGLSDHTNSDAIALAAVGVGAGIFEKHFYAGYDNVSTPDSLHSATYEVMKRYVSRIRIAYEAMGDGAKRPTAGEAQMVKQHLRRLIAIKDISEGEPFINEVNFGAYRGKKEILRAAQPESVHDFDGKRAAHCIARGDGITHEDLQ